MSGERAVLALAVLFLLGILRLTLLVRSLSPTAAHDHPRPMSSASLRHVPSGDSHWPATRRQPADDQQAMRTRPTPILGGGFPARGPPGLRPGCAFLSRGHLEERFVRGDACYSRDEIHSILGRLVLTAADLLTQLDISYFLDSGTLLGAHRAGGVIPHDVDGDLGIDAVGFERLRTTPVGIPEGYQLDVWNSSVHEPGGRDDKLPARLIHTSSALYVDIFVFAEVFLGGGSNVDEVIPRHMIGPPPSLCFLGCVGCRTLDNGSVELLVPHEWIYPLVACAFEGAMLWCPRQTARYLEFQYGANFMDPE